MDIYKGMGTISVDGTLELGWTTATPGLTELGALTEAGRQLTVGALVVPASWADKVRATLASAGWLKPGRSITPYNGDVLAAEGKRVAIHLVPVKSTILLMPARAAEAPVDVAALLDDPKVAWVPWLRTGSKECLGGADAAEQQMDLAEKVFEKSTKSGKTQQPDGVPRKFRYAELFAGIGGFRVALDALGGECVFASELEREARDVYAANHGCVPRGDITEIPATDLPAHDLLTAGFPCQSFSKAGEMKAFRDPRGALFFEVTRLLRHHQPACFILENVPQLAELNDGKLLAVVLEELTSAGYTTHYRILSSRPLVAQRRERLYFVGFRDNLGAKVAASFQWPAWAEDADLDVVETNEMVAPTFPEASHCWPTLASQVLENPEDGWPEHELSEHQWKKVQATTEFNTSARSRLSNLEGAARTLISSYRSSFQKQSEFVPPPPHGPFASCRPRFFTPRECCRLQGFPEYFQIGCSANPLRSYHMVGNAVCVPVVQDIAAALFATGVLSVQGQLNMGSLM